MEANSARSWGDDAARLDFLTSHRRCRAAHCHLSAEHQIAGDFAPSRCARPFLVVENFGSFTTERNAGHVVVAGGRHACVDVVCRVFRGTRRFGKRTKFDLTGTTRRCVATTRSAIARVVDELVQHVAIAVPAFRTRQIPVVHDASGKLGVCPTTALTRTSGQGFVAKTCARKRSFRTAVPCFEYRQISCALNMRRTWFFFDDGRRDRDRTDARDTSAKFVFGECFVVGACSIPSNGRIKVCLDSIHSRTNFGADGPRRGQLTGAFWFVARARGARWFRRFCRAFERENWCVIGTRWWLMHPVDKERHVFPSFRRWRNTRAVGAKTKRSAVGAAIRTSVERQTGSTL